MNENPYQSPSPEVPDEDDARACQRSPWAMSFTGVFAGAFVGVTAGAAAAGMIGVLAGILIFATEETGLRVIEFVMMLSISGAILGTIVGGCFGAIIGGAAGCFAAYHTSNHRAQLLMGTRMAAMFVGAAMGMLAVFVVNYSSEMSYVAFGISATAATIVSGICGSIGGTILGRGLGRIAWDWSELHRPLE